MAISCSCNKDAPGDLCDVDGGVGSREGDRDQPPGHHETQRHSTSTSPFEKRQQPHSIEIDPSRGGSPRRRRLYIGNAPNSVKGL